MNTLLVVCASLAATSAWAGGPPVVYDIPAGDADKTLALYRDQTPIEMLYVVDAVKGRKTKAVSGMLEASEALDKMLEGTDLVARFKPDFTFAAVVRRAEPSSGSAEPRDRSALASTQMGSLEQDRMRDLFGDQKLEEVVVTGTLIRGVLDIMSPLEFVTKKEMKKAAYATVYDALQDLPVNFGGGPSEDFSGVGNYGRGTSANLRGLGAGATLVLVNGHRQPLSGYESDFVDLSSVAWSAVDHIEVLPDGAAALYGSDAIAGVVNIIMRKDLDGAETQVRLGGAGGGADEKLVAQLFGKTWRTGSALISYQYSERSALDASARAYAANTDKRPLGGIDHSSYLSNPANILDPRTFLPAYGVPAGQDGQALSASDLLPGQINLFNTYNGVQLLPDRRSHSLFVTGQQKLGERFELFAEGRFARREIDEDYLAADQLLIVPLSNPFAARANPYKGAPFVAVSYNFADDFGPIHVNALTKTFSGNVGVNTRVSDSWNIRLAESYGRESMEYAGENQPDPQALREALRDSDPDTAFNPFGDGSHTNPATLEAIRTTLRLQSTSGIESTAINADGTAFNLPTGTAKLAVGAERRSEWLERGASTLHSFDRSIESAFAELALPIVGNREDSRAVPRLELSLAARYEQYSDFGNTTNPKVGLRWAPSNSLKLRTSWGTSFKAPKLLDIYDTSNNAAGVTSLKDPLAPGGTSVVLVMQGSNPSLKDETASTWTAGIDLVPEFAEGLTLSLTYYSIDYNDRILVPGPPNAADILLQESLWSSAITRNPTAAQIDAVCDSPVLVGSAADCKAAPAAAIVDFRVRNMAETRVRGVDFKMDQILRTRYGRFDLGLNGGYVLGFRQASSDTAPMKSLLNTVGNPTSLRVRGTAEWYQHDLGRPGFGASATVEYSGSYADPNGGTVRPVNSTATVNLRLSYRTPQGGGAFDGLEFGLNGVNVFDRSPPFVDRDAGYDQINAEPYGRVLSFTIQKNW